MLDKSIFIIEDDFEICEFYKLLLGSQGYSINVANTGYDALVALGLEANKDRVSVSVLPMVPSLIILDMLLPEVDGYAVASRLLEDDRMKEIPIIAISVKSQMSDMVCSLTNVKHFLVKPVDHEMILCKVRELTA